MAAASLDETLVRARLKEAADDAGKIKTIVTEIAAQLTSQAARPDPYDGSTSVQELSAADIHYALLEYPLALGIALSQWLSAHDEESQYGKELVHFLSVQFLPPTSYPAMAVRDIPTPQLRLTAYRLCSVFAAPSVVFGYCLAILASDKSDQDKLEATKLPLEQLTSDRPDSTSRLLDHYFADALGASTAPAVLLSLRDNLATRRQIADALPHLNEFDLTHEQRNVFAAYRRHVSREITGKAESQSVFAMIATRRHFNYATRVSFEVAGVPTGAPEQAVEMQELSGSMEMPISEHLDPQSARRKRSRLWEGNDP